VLCELVLLVRAALPSRLERPPHPLQVGHLVPAYLFALLGQESFGEVDPLFEFRDLARGARSPSESPAG
jgi:hypothetical protein